MTNRITTGIEGLDTVLGGGFMRHNSILIKGAPGTGKTSIGIQILLQGIKEGESAIICSFEQFPQQLYRDMLGFGWDLKKLVAEKKLFIFFLQPEDLVAPEGSSHAPILSRILALSDEHGARRLLVDSITHFNRVSMNAVNCRSILLSFINEVKTGGLSPILTAELSNSENREYTFEEYLVDEVLLLHNDQSDHRGSLPLRTLEVSKSRGHAHARGRHPFEFGEEGINVYPHIPPAAFTSNEMNEYSLATSDSGVAGIDKMLGGGYLRGTVTIAAGMSGTYKTTLASAFLAQTLANSECGLLITFEEMPQQLLKMLSQRGIDLTAAVDCGQVKIHHYVPGVDSLDRVYWDLQNELIKGGVTRVVIDSLNDFERSLQPEDAKQYLGMFLAALRRAGVTTLLTQKLQSVSNTNPIADILHASMADTVVYLGNVEIESQLRKVISILKSRGARADSDLREIFCNGTGLHVGQKFHGLSGILQGTAHGQYKQTVENIFQPLYFIRDFAKMGSLATDDQRQKILNDIISQVGSLDIALKDHFGFDPEEAKRQ